MPPKVNVGAEENEPASGTGEALALAAASTGLSGSETAAEVGSVAVTCAVASRAGAAALAAPAEVVSGNPTLDGDTTCGLPDVSSGLGPAAAAGASLGAAIGSADVAIDSKTEGTGSADSAARVIGLEAETAMLVCGVCFCAGMTVTRGATGELGAKGQHAELPAPVLPPLLRKARAWPLHSPRMPRVLQLRSCAAVRVQRVTCLLPAPH